MKANNFQSFGTIVAVVISLVALMVSIYEANLMKAQQRALVWPHFIVSPSYSGNGFSFIADNYGTGPAIIESVEVRYKDSLINGYDDLLNQIKPNHIIGYDRLRMSSLNQTVFKAGEERVVFNMPWDDETREMAKQMIHVSIKVQYKSVLGDKWVYDSKTREHIEGEFQALREFGN